MLRAYGQKLRKAFGQFLPAALINCARQGAPVKPLRTALKKVRKLLRSPNLFLRDFFLKRVPLSVGADINRKTTQDTKSTQIRGLKRRAPMETLFSGYISFSQPVDAVITWVDGNDPEFIMLREAHQEHDTSGKVAANNVARYQSRDEIRFCVRSIRTYAPWIKTIYIVTNGQVPDWLDETQDRVKIITHDQIIPQKYLPTFNSHVIESCLHHIPGLSEHYVYFNDDVMLLQPAQPTDFFTETGLLRGFVSSAVIPNGPISVADTPSMTAIKNARAALFEKTGCYLSPMFAHTFHPQRKSVALACEEVFATALHKCRQNKFRNTADILCTSFLFPCYAYVNGDGVFSKLRAWYFNVRDATAESLYSELLAMKDDQSGPRSVCLNDHLPATLEYNFAGYETHLAKFLQHYFPLAHAAEKDRISDTPSVRELPVEDITEEVLLVAVR